MKILRIDGRPQKVFVLKETDDRVVYIPVKSCFLVDYKKLLELEKRGGDMLKLLANETLDNGRNALVTYDSLIQVLHKTGEAGGSRLRKPDEAITNVELGKELDEKSAQKAQDAITEQEEPKPQRRKPGPRPGSKRAKKADPSE